MALAAEGSLKGVSPLRKRLTRPTNSEGASATHSANSLVG